MSQQPPGHRIYCGNVGKVWVDEFIQRNTKVGGDKTSLDVIGWLDTSQPPPVIPILKDGSKNRRLYIKYSLDVQLNSRRKHTPTQTHTTMYMCFESDWSSLVLRIENNNNKIITPKLPFDICFLCLSAPWWVSHLIYAVQDEGQRSHLLFLQEEEEEESDRPAAHKSVPDWLKEKHRPPRRLMVCGRPRHRKTRLRSPGEVMVLHWGHSFFTPWTDGFIIQRSFQISTVLKWIRCFTSVRSQHSSQWTCQHWMEVSGVVYVSCTGMQTVSCSANKLPLEGRRRWNQLYCFIIFKDL